ncbi:MAG: 4-hydroxy-tetrahydrodipicolinate synthase [Tannerella sp.]|jgi:4-hydroxy-tetrahydrodipicolinate synthase|nr:4-hydroxy-tetrahydrodipicolinate synthase [Tannerella sp.]
MTTMNLKGMGVALVTPFGEDGSVDFEALQRLVEYQVQNGTDYLVMLGTTAETPTLAAEEKAEIVRRTVAQVRRRIPVVLGVGGNCTREVVEKLERDDFCDIDGILSVVPYYSRPSQEGIYRHYRAIAEAAPKPLILYNVPGRTGVNMTAETALRIAREFEHVVAVKEASGNIAQIDRIIRNRPPHFEVISGDDSITFPLIALGAVGVISVVGNALPAEFGRMVRLALSGDYENARAIHARFVELFELLTVDGNPAGVKCLLHLTGHIENCLRLPLVPASLVTDKRIRETLQRQEFRL